jgi:hypothetical protein
MNTKIPVTLLLLWACAGWTHQGNQVHTLVELDDGDLARIDLADGGVEDWQDILGEPTLTALDFEPVSEAGGYNPADFDFRVWCAWHGGSGRIYVAMEQVDDVYFNEFSRGGGPSMEAFDSSISIMVDGDHSGGRFFFLSEEFDGEREPWLLATQQQAQWYWALGQVFDGGGHLDTLLGILSSGYTDWFLAPPFAAGGGGVRGENPTQAVTEFYITPFDRFVWNDPEGSVVSDLKVGKVIGLSLTIGDRDPPVEGQGVVYALPGAQEISSGADLFADFLLTGKIQQGPGSSAVQHATWGKLKRDSAQ